MAKAIWRGYIILGQLGMPVRLYKATRSSGPQLVTLHSTDGEPVSRLLWCKAEQKQISPKETIKAVDVGGGLITLSERELQRVAGNAIKTIDVLQFSDPGDVPPLFYETPYYIVPGTGGERAYSLLLRVLETQNKVAITRLMLYRRERLAMISAHKEGALVLQRVRFKSEVLPQKEVKFPPLPEPAEAEVEALAALVNRFSLPFNVDEYHDSYNERLNQLVERKKRGLTLATEMPNDARKLGTPESEILSALTDTLETRGSIPGPQQ